MDEEPNLSLTVIREHDLKYLCAFYFFLVVSSTVELLDALSESKQVEAAEIYARLWVSTCGASGRGWLGEVLLMICNAGGGNPLTDAALYRPIVEKHILDTAVFDLRILQALAFFNPQQLVEWINIGELPAILPEANMDERRPKKTNELIHELKTTKDWGAVVPKLVDTYRSVGVGITGEYYGLYYANGELLGVRESFLLCLSLLHVSFPASFAPNSIPDRQELKKVVKNSGEREKIHG